VSREQQHSKRISSSAGAQALISANASGLPPPVHRGNWMYAAHARLRWFEPNGKPRYMRPWTW
jgi:hypothetical protein